MSHSERSKSENSNASVSAVSFINELRAQVGQVLGRFVPNWLGVELLTILLLLINSIYYFSRFFLQQNQLDIYDEAFYLSYAGVKTNFFENIEIGPLYRLWYEFLGVFTKDPILQYQWNSIIMPALVAPVLYFFLRRFSFDRNQSLLAAILVIFYPPLATITRYTHHFLVIFTLAGLALASNIKEIWVRHFSFCLVFFFATYIRPEYSITFICMSAIYIVFSAVQLLKSKKINYVREFLSVVLVLLSLLQVLGFHSFKFSGESQYRKGMGMFAKFNNYRIQEMNPKANFSSEEAYGGAKSIAEAFLNNPREFLIHVAFSTDKFFKRVLDVVYSYRILGTLAYICLVFLVFCIFMGTRGLQLSNPFRKNEIWGLLFFLVFPIVVTCLLLDTSKRYLLPVVLILIILVSILVPKTNKSNSIGFLFVFLTCQFFLPNPINKNYPSAFYYGEEGLFDSGSCKFWIQVFSEIRTKTKMSPSSNIRVWSRAFPSYYLNMNGETKFIDIDFPSGPIDEVSRAPSEYFDIAISDEAFDWWLEQFQEPKRKFAKDFFTSPLSYDFQELSIPCKRGHIYISRKILANQK